MQDSYSHDRKQTLKSRLSSTQLTLPERIALFGGAFASLVIAIFYFISGG